LDISNHGQCSLFFVLENCSRISAKQNVSHEAFITSAPFVLHEWWQGSPHLLISLSHAEREDVAVTMQKLAMGTDVALALISLVMWNQCTASFCQQASDCARLVMSSLRLAHA
jgi:hypothetical protein